METLGCSPSSQPRAQLSRGNCLKQEKTGTNKRNGEGSAQTRAGPPLNQALHSPEGMEIDKKSNSLREEILPLASFLPP